MDKVERMPRLEAGVGIHQLTEPVSVLLQGLFFAYTSSLRKKLQQGEEMLDEDTALGVLGVMLTHSEHSVEELVDAFGRVACLDSIKALRFIEETLPILEDNARSLALLAQLELRMHITGDLLDEQQVILASGLGGDGDLIRLHGACAQRDLQPWEPYQRELMTRELKDQCARHNGKFEWDKWGDEYYIFSILLPYYSDMAQMLQDFVASCNEFGNFIHPNCHVTNVVELSPDLVEGFIQLLHTAGRGAVTIEDIERIFNPRHSADAPLELPDISHDGSDTEVTDDSGDIPMIGDDSTPEDPTDI